MIVFSKQTSPKATHKMRGRPGAVFMGLMVMGASILGLSACRTTADVLNIGDAATKTNSGPCPRAFAIYDAARIVDFGDNPERFANIRFTGEIQAVRSLCRYYDTVPIEGDLEIEFALGRGPAAQQSSATYEYFVAVTRKNIDVINKKVFPLVVNFPAGADRVNVTERIDRIVIPRGTETTSGENFEIIVGFVVTPKQREFNAEGKRFRVSAGQDQ